MSLKQQVDIEKLPEHVAIVMDGNGRWAKGQGKYRIFGHKNGVKAVHEVVEASAELGIKFLTLFAFSTENWNRPEIEVKALMELLVDTIKKQTPTLQKNNIKLQSIGNLDDLPVSCRKTLAESIEATKDNTRMTLVLALSYSAKWDMINAIRKIASETVENKINAADISEDLISSYLSTAGMPHPELLIRTSGEHRISNFLLWEIAYSELYFTPTLWPDFRKEDLYKALIDYQKRERRFGKTSEQLRKNK